MIDRKKRHFIVFNVADFLSDRKRHNILQRTKGKTLNNITDVHTFPLKPVVGDRLSSALSFSYILTILEIILLKVAQNIQ